MTKSTPTRITVHRPELLGTPRVKRDKQAPVAPVVAAHPPGMIGMAKTMLSSGARWIAAGRPMTSEAGLRLRKDKCGQCHYWNPAGWFGRGRCTICGCSGLKLAWATERCPKKPPELPEWIEETQPPADSVDPQI